MPLADIIASLTWDYWFMFFVAFCIATTAMASGIEGAAFFAPIFILFLGLPADVAIGTGLITEVFGFTSGLVSYAYRRQIDFRLGRAILVATVPMAIVGTILSFVSPALVLKAILGLLLLVLALEVVHSLRTSKTEDDIPEAEKDASVTDRWGNVIRYKSPDIRRGRIITAIGALFIGLVSVGQGPFNAYYLVQKSKIPPKVATATGVFIVVVTALVAAVGHLIRFLYIGPEAIVPVANLVIFTVPAVMMGGVFGTWVGSRLPTLYLRYAFVAIFGLVAAGMLYEVASKWF